MREKRTARMRGGHLREDEAIVLKGQNHLPLHGEDTNLNCQNKQTNKNSPQKTQILIHRVTLYYYYSI